MTDRILSDTTTLAHLTKASKHSAAYNKIVGHKRVVISFQSRGELLSADYTAARRKRLENHWQPP
jgi:hypothetical protein